MLGGSIDFSQGWEERRASDTVREAKEGADPRSGQIGGSGKRKRGFLVLKVPRIEEVRKRLSGKLPPWSELEGEADEMLDKENRD